MDVEVESSSESETSQNAQGVIGESDQGLEWSANYSVQDVI